MEKEDRASGDVDENYRLRSQLKKTKNDMEILQARFDELTWMSMMHIAAMPDLEEESRDLRDQLEVVEDQQSTPEDAGKTLEDTRQEVGEYMDQLASVRQENESLSRYKSALEQRIAELKAMLAKNVESSATNRKQSLDMANEIEQLKAQIEAERRKREDMVQQGSDGTSRNDPIPEDAQEKLEALKRQVCRLRVENERLRGKLAAGGAPSDGVCNDGHGQVGNS